MSQGRSSCPGLTCETTLLLSPEMSNRRRCCREVRNAHWVSLPAPGKELLKPSEFPLWDCSQQAPSVPLEFPKEVTLGPGRLHRGDRLPEGGTMIYRPGLPAPPPDLLEWQVLKISWMAGGPGSWARGHTTVLEGTGPLQPPMLCPLLLFRWLSPSCTL